MNEESPVSSPEPADIFLWANHTDSIKNDVAIELFLFNKNYTVYSTDTTNGLEAQLKPLFLYDLIGQVIFGAGTGMSIREYEKSEAEENVLLYTSLDKVQHAAGLLHSIEKNAHEIIPFSEEEHDFKTIKGIIARCTEPANPGKYFYVIKAIQQNNALKGPTVWEFRDGKFDRFSPDLGVKIPTDNQVLIVDGSVFAFNVKKFEKLFQYDYKQQLLADQKVSEIERHYKLSFPDGIDLQTLVRDRKKVVSKLQKLTVGEISQNQVLEYADDLELELMTDDAGAIIILDGKDLDTFVGLINEDYITSQVTGKRYEITGKKLLDEPSGSEPPRGI